MPFARFALSCALLQLTACALIQPLAPPAPTEAEAARCLDLYTELDGAVAQYGVTPSSPARIQGFPYLRVGRFLASYRGQPLEDVTREAWLTHLAELDREARQVELDSLPRPVLTELAIRHVRQSTLPETLAACSKRLQAYDLKSPMRFKMLTERAAVPDDYYTLSRVLGLYPLTALPVSHGVFRWQEETRELFAQPLETLPVQGKLQRLRPPEEALVAPNFARLARDALDILQLEPAQLASLFAAHAPVWEIDVAGAFDLPGAPRWDADGLPTVDSQQPVVYRYPSYTRWQGRVLLQLNYLIWFAERPLSGSLDILGGALDGVIWRVTLDSRGVPLVYDSIHSCGCYHLFFPSRALSLRPEALREPEPPLLVQTAPRLTPAERIVIRLGSGTHYIHRVYAAAPKGTMYTLREYRELYAVPTAAGGKRSLFGPDGLVPGTERGERWLLWPMGVPSPGAMRERGRHATAFVGRRHFDAPDLLDEIFEPTDKSP